MSKVLFVTNEVPAVSGQIIEDAPEGFDVHVHPATLSVDELKPLIGDTDYLILFPSRIADDALRAAPNLKLIQLVSAGFDQMNLELCRELGVPIANNGGANAIDVAEHTFTLILGVYRRLREVDHNVRTDQWRAIDTGLSTYTIHNKTVGIIGMGKIGQEVAKRLQGWEAKVIYHDAYVAEETVAHLNVTSISLAELLQNADIVSLHVPLNDSTHHLIGAAELAQMRSTAILINTCRGPVVDEAALIEALRAERIRGAGLDVLESEPPAADNPLLDMENVLLTPHSAGITYDTWRRRGQFIFENLQRVEAGERPQALVLDA